MVAAVSLTAISKVSSSSQDIGVLAMYGQQMVYLDHLQSVSASLMAREIQDRISTRKRADLDNCPLRAAPG
jgi:hypothetical protein